MSKIQHNQGSHPRSFKVIPFFDAGYLTNGWTYGHFIIDNDGVF